MFDPNRIDVRINAASVIDSVARSPEARSRVCGAAGVFDGVIGVRRGGEYAVSVIEIFCALKMEGACGQLLTGASYCGRPSNKRNRLDSNSVRKIRVICDDPDATDSSSDDEEAFGLKRRIVQEISLPYSEAEVSCQGSNNGDRTMVFSKKKKGASGGRRRSHRTSSSSEDSEKNSESVISRASPVSETNGSDGKSCEIMEEEIELQMLDLESVEEEINKQMELDSLFMNDYGEVFDDLSVFYDVRMCEFDGLDLDLDRSIDLPKLEFDFDLGKEELAWIEEPLNIAFCP